MIDEVHLQAYFDYKAGFVTGAAANSSNPCKNSPRLHGPELAFSKQRCCAHLTVAQIDARMLHDLLRNLLLTWRQLVSES
ncbi:hypothetical protein HPB48_023207 [Haemaphysalis longicornis]|uniref:Uncharacterized protein n=1 Tax=Haemaphysalis longicornis TaxID=44386 RepID=A0A9J6H4N3_HAELO|nr:hypothetical protein HPB48_023207 [Haemaphysalis longicornis]